MRTIFIISAILVAVLILAKLLFPKSSKAAALKSVVLVSQAKDKVIEGKNIAVQKVTDLDSALAAKLS